jgi:putative radical SAM enzyme (TIGR03279 family)
MIRIAAVHDDSLGSELGLTAGTELLSINGYELHDFLDWEFRAADDRFTLLAQSADGDVVEYDVERPEGLPLGVELERPSIRRCANRCDFCFVDGLPEGLRSPLYIRDDDYRLSFRYGNFATLTNLKRRDIDRIIEYRLSPLYVSVHATDPTVRRRVLRNPRAPEIVPQLRRFGLRGIRFHTQIVLQPDVNDGSVLERSLEDLYALRDAVLSVSVVPVGLTEFSKHHLVRQPSAAECRAAITLVDRYARRAFGERDAHWAYGSDELYLVAELPLPPPERYDGFEQVENGVGAVRYLQRQIDLAHDTLPDLGDTRAAVVTGKAMEHLMPTVLATLATRTRGSFELLVVENDLFGPSVTTAGLLPGLAIQRALEERHDLDLALLPAEALNESDRFVDDLSLEELATRVPANLCPSRNFADAFTRGASV